MKQMFNVGDLVVTTKKTNNWFNLDPNGEVALIYEIAEYHGRLKLYVLSCNATFMFYFDNEVKKC
jgi:hypothetical protein